MQFTYRTSKEEVKDHSVGMICFSKEKEDQIYIKENGQKVIEIGLSDQPLQRRKFLLIARRIIACARQGKMQRIAIVVDELISPELGMAKDEAMQLLVTQCVLANYTFDRYKSDEKKKEIFFVKEVLLLGTFSDAEKKAVQDGILIGESTNHCRDFANTPGSDLNPESLVEETNKLVSDTPIKMSVLEKSEIEQLRMQGVMGVTRGSEVPPKFIVLEYTGGGSENPIVLVGKGVTFDAGGLNVKPDSGMFGMHMDMSGAAAVINTIVLAAKLKLQKNIVALIPAVENLPSGTAYKPGDVLKMMSGITVEVVHTDAEGRLILADALTYAKKFNPRLVIDVATLTGAAVVALGERACAIFTKEERLERLARECGEKSGDFVWPLPLWEEYEQELKSNVADIGNIAPNMTRYGGAITAAAFLHHFAREYPWMHIDMAPRMTTVKDQCLADGASGAPVCMLIELIKQY